MEELWKDISLNASPSTLDQHGVHRHRTDSSSPPFPNMILQDFLAGPLNRPLYPSQAAAAEELPFPRTQAALSLDSGPEFQLLGEADQAKTHSNSSSNNVAVNATSGSFISSSLSAGPPSPTALFSFCSRKFPTEMPETADRHQKRMIKNRESAARSRARKQAYTNELELEVSHLKKENAKLQRQNEELMRNQAAATKSTLHRSSTAPF